MKIKAVSAGLLAAALATTPISSASARDNFYRHGHGHGHRFGLIGAVVGGVAALAVAPFVILGDAVSDGHRDRGYDQGDDDYGRGSAYNQPPPSGYYADRRGGYDGPPPGYYPPPPPSQYYAQGYAPPQNYYPPGRQYGPPQQYAPQQQNGYSQQPGYYPPPDGE
jgi:hypothetical protein